MCNCAGQGGYDVDVYDGPDGSRIYSYTDGFGRLVRRVRQFPDGRQLFLIDNRYERPDRDFRDDVVVLPPAPEALAPERYVLDADRADETAVYDTLVAPPVAPLPQRYTLDQIRYSPDLRARMRSVDLNTVIFDTGSWAVAPEQADSSPCWRAPSTRRSAIIRRKSTWSKATRTRSATTSTTCRSPTAAPRRWRPF